MRDSHSKRSLLPSTNPSSKRNASESEVKRKDSPIPSPLPPHKKRKGAPTRKSAILHTLNLDVPLIFPSTGLPLDSIRLHPDRSYTIGRGRRGCDFRFDDRRVSKRHCQLLFDSVDRKIYLLNGVLCCNVSDSDSDCLVSEFRRKLECCDKWVGEGRVRVSLNGVFVNGDRVKRGMARELSAGDKVSLVCGHEGGCRSGVQIGFVVQGIVIKEEVVKGLDGILLERHPFVETTCLIGHSQGSVSSGKRNKRVFAIPKEDLSQLIMPQGYEVPRKKCRGAAGRAKFLLSQCRNILQSDDPVSYVRQCVLSDCGMKIAKDSSRKLSCSLGMSQFDNNKLPIGDGIEATGGSTLVFRHQAQSLDGPDNNQEAQNDYKCGDVEHGSSGAGHFHEKGIAAVHSESAVVADHCKGFSLSPICKEDDRPTLGGAKTRPLESCCVPPGNFFYLNRLNFMDRGSFNHDNVVSLPELLYPIQSILRIFIATFTSDIPWFLSDSKIPQHLPVTIACHNTERCWSPSPDKRTFVPYSDFPQLVVVCPPFPEAIAFGKDRKRQGIGCHHPKLIVLQRMDTIRVIITSANLVANQWNNVTNTVWWQDFPRRIAPDVSSLFTQLSDGVTSQGSRSDFAAQLAGFMASLVVDIPSQAHWIIELTKYNFGGAMGYLVASVPGIHPRRIHCAFRHPPDSTSVQIIGSVEASVVGLSHLFHAAADTDGAQLKRLASFLGKSHENADGMSEVVLRRNNNVPADVNAVSVFVRNPDQVSGDLIQLGFLPRHVAKWVSPLWDCGLFSFIGYIYPKQALKAALGESNTRVQLILHMSQGPCFYDTIAISQPEHVTAFCSLIASLQRCTGLWRLEEVLGKYKWPDLDESDFVYGSSSIGSSINAQFFATFSAAVGKKSLQLFDSEESDPEWGCWSASQELKNPSIRIIFPTIESVRNACNGIFPSRRILCFSEKTWQRLKTVDILHDAVPQPYHRVGHPMHVKVARRRFQSKTEESSFGWVYCGSHNFSPAAWGRPIANRSSVEPHELEKTDFSLGSRLHVCNYELGIIFIFPPTKGINKNDCTNLDDIVLPFIVPAPKYRPTDRPATKQAMREALAELAEEERQKLAGLASIEDMVEEIPDEEEEVANPNDYVVEEKEEEKAYAEMLWIQVDSSQSC